MLNKPLTLINALVLGISAVISWGCGPYVWAWLRPVWWLMVTLLTIAAMFAWADWGAGRAVDHYRSLREAWTITPQLKMMDKYQNLRPEIVELMMRETPSISVLSGEPVPAFYLRLGGDEVPFDFIHQFVSYGDDTYLCPVRYWAEGTRQREWATMLTNHFVMIGYADVAAGNHPARWVEKTRALRWIGLEDGQLGKVAKVYV
jgi:hypothetical protein